MGCSVASGCGARHGAPITGFSMRQESRLGKGFMTEGTGLPRLSASGLVGTEIGQLARPAAGFRTSDFELLNHATQVGIVVAGVALTAIGAGNAVVVRPSRCLMGGETGGTKDVSARGGGSIANHVKTNATLQLKLFENLGLQEPVHWVSTG